MKKKKINPNPWKKQKNDDHYAKMDYDKFPNYLRQIWIKSRRGVICKIDFVGYLHDIVAKRSNIHFEMPNVNDGFDAKNKKEKKPYLDKADFDFDNNVRMIHLFNEHSCIAEISIRGRITEISTSYTRYTFHIARGITYKKNSNYFNKKVN